MGEKYPSYYSSAALLSFMAAIQSLGFALCVDRDWNHWKLGWNIRLLTVLYLVRDIDSISESMIPATNLYISVAIYTTVNCFFCCIFLNFYLKDPFIYTYVF